MKKQALILSFLAFLFLSFSTKFLQKEIYDNKLVQTKTLQLKVLGQNNPNVKEPYAILKMSRKSDRVKVKYFAAKLYDGTAVGTRYSTWSANKNVVAISSGTYMDNCTASIAKPMGLCIDDGNIVNNKVEDGYGGLIVVYATGGMVASAVEKGDLTIKDKTKGNVTINIKNLFQKEQFISWAKEERATVFQTNLFIYKDSVRLIENPNEKQKDAARRFLAVCKEEDGTVSHYVVNLPTASTLYQGVKKAKDYLKNIEDVAQIVFMINLDTGCQNFYNVFNSDGSRKSERNFTGDQNLTLAQTANLLAYYFE
jgi:hypothetical protein